MSTKHEHNIDRFWQNKASDAARQQLLDELQRDEEWKKQLEEAFYEHVTTGQTFLPEHRSQAILDKLHAAIQAAETPVRKTGTIRRIIGWSAAAMIAVLAGAGVYHYTGRPHHQPPVAARAQQQNELQLQRNESDSIMLLKLNDGSRVALSPGSSIRYYQPFKEGKREVSLAGKAKFTVNANAASPFTVHANGLATTALGTEFIVNTRIAGSDVQVQLFSGKVKLHSSSSALSMKDIYLTPGQQFSLNKTQQQFTVKNFAEDKQFNTKQTNNNSNTSLAFNQQPLTEVLEQISKRYNVRFNYAEKTLNNVQVTGEFLPDDSLDVVLSILSAANNLEFTKQHDVIVVHRNR